jgi:hypothetical protein
VGIQFAIRVAGVVGQPCAAVPMSAQPAATALRVVMERSSDSPQPGPRRIGWLSYKTTPDGRVVV